MTQGTQSCVICTNFLSTDVPIGDGLFGRGGFHDSTDRPPFFALNANGNIGKLLVVEYREPSFGIDD
jgi:hypothetical protein